MSGKLLGFSDFDDKKLIGLKSYVTTEILDWINKSDSLKEQILNYLGNEKTGDVVISKDNPSAASYVVPQGGSAGFATFGVDRLKSSTDFISAISHEFGHAGVENPDEVLGKARSAALTSGDVTAYEAACNLTEGYARLATARVVDEILQKLPAGEAAFRLAYGHPEYTQYKNLLPDAAASTWTMGEMNSALAFALGELNKSNITSTTGASYLQYCRNSAAAVLGNGNTSPPAPWGAGITFTDEFNSDGGYSSDHRFICEPFPQRLPQPEPSIHAYRYNLAWCHLDATVVRRFRAPLSGDGRTGTERTGKSRTSRYDAEGRDGVVSRTCGGGRCLGQPACLTNAVDYSDPRKRVCPAPLCQRGSRRA